MGSEIGAFVPAIKDPQHYRPFKRLALSLANTHNSQIQCRGERHKLCHIGGCSGVSALSSLRLERYEKKMSNRRMFDHFEDSISPSS